MATFLEQQLSMSAVSLAGPCMNLLNSVIFDVDNWVLCRVPEMIEIKEDLWSILQDSSPGPDGFSASFFHHAWDIINDDLLKLAIEFF